MADLDLTGYKLTFSDEFNTRSISATGAGTTWADMRSQWLMSDGKADVGFGISSFVDPSSGYDPFKVEGGALIITAAGDVTPSGFPGSMESGLITTQGNWSQKQGYFEMRADLSDAPHAWDAFWMAPDQQVNPGTPDAWQELDVVEHYGENDKGVYSHIHTTDPSNGIPWQQNRQVYSELANKDGYHTYGVLWEADKLSFYVDGEFKGSQATPSDYSNPQYMMANLATQPGAVGGEQMKIDYIRAYSKDGSNPTVALGQVSAPDGHDPGMYGATALNSSAPPAVDHTTDVVVPPVTPPVVAADDSAPVTPPIVAADDSAPVTPPVVAGMIARLSLRRLSPRMIARLLLRRLSPRMIARLSLRRLSPRMIARLSLRLLSRRMISRPPLRLLSPPIMSRQPRRPLAPPMMACWPIRPTPRWAITAMARTAGTMIYILIRWG